MIPCDNPRDEAGSAISVFRRDARAALTGQNDGSNPSKPVRRFRQSRLGELYLHDIALQACIEGFRTQAPETLAVPDIATPAAVP